MPRIARTVAVGYPHHIVQRGNGRQKVFFASEDKQKYLELVKRYTLKWDCTISAYCLMDNHMHILAVPKKAHSLNKYMQGVAMCYAQYANRKYGRGGRLWESRYYSCTVDSDRYLWATARYIELNPVRAGIVKKAEDYQYSSARAHVKGTDDDILGEALFDDEQRVDYIEMLRSGIDEREADLIRLSISTGRPYGGSGFVDMLEGSLGRVLRAKPHGRPRIKREI